MGLVNSKSNSMVRKTVIFLPLLFCSDRDLNYRHSAGKYGFLISLDPMITLVLLIASQRSQVYTKAVSGKSE